MLNKKVGLIISGIGLVGGVIAVVNYRVKSRKIQDRIGSRQETIKQSFNELRRRQRAQSKKEEV